MGSWKAAQPPERLQSGQTHLPALQTPAGALHLRAAKARVIRVDVLGGRLLKGSFKTSESLIFLSICSKRIILL